MLMVELTIKIHLNNISFLKFNFYIWKNLNQKPMKKLIKNIALLLIAVTAFSCSEEANKELGKKSIAEIVAATEDFSSLKEALDITGLTATFEAAGDYTVFAPTNDAFAAVLGAQTIAEFNTANPGVLANVLKYHVLSSRALSTNLSDNIMVSTLLGKDFKVSITENTDPATLYYTDNVITLKNLEIDPLSPTPNTEFTATVIARDVACTNGILHPIDAVMLPPTQ